MANLSRRQLFGFGAAGAFAAACASNLGSEMSATLADVSFQHGVASGDATSKTVILWSRVTPTVDEKAVSALCLISREAGVLNSVDLNLDDPFADLKLDRVIPVDTGPARDFTLKVDAGADTQGKLKADTTYHFAFAVKTPQGWRMSAVGRTTTLPKSGTSDFSAAVVSCSNLPFGYFNAYEAIAKDDRVQAIIHLGDYFYEYGRDGYGGEVGAQLGREVEPAHEVVTLKDYRRRHAQYKADAQLQAAHANKPWYCAWDDHESTNNSYRTGAENHQPDLEGEWSVRKAAAIQAYLEWMPVRDPAPGLEAGSIYRAFEIGDLASLFMLESRLLGRSDELSYAAALSVPEDQQRAKVMEIVQEAMSPERTMLGAVQEAWLGAELKRSREEGKRWQVLGNQIIMAKVRAPNLVSIMTDAEKEAVYKQAPWAKSFIEFTQFGLPLNLDAWDGFVAARERLYADAKAAGANLVTVTGDTHTAWANELHDANGDKRGVEFGCTSITSPGLGKMIPNPAINSAMVDANDEVAFYDAFGHGYTLLTLSEDAVTADYIKVSDILTRSYDVSTSKQARAALTESGVGAIELK